MSKVARERQATLRALQQRFAEVEARNRSLTRVVNEAGLQNAGGKAEKAAAELDAAPATTAYKQAARGLAGRDSVHRAAALGRHPQREALLCDRIATTTRSRGRTASRSS